MMRACYQRADFSIEHPLPSGILRRVTDAQAVPELLPSTAAGLELAAALERFVAGEPLAFEVNYDDRNDRAGGEWLTLAVDEESIGRVEQERVGPAGERCSAPTLPINHEQLVALAQRLLEARVWQGIERPSAVLDADSCRLIVTVGEHSAELRAGASAASGDPRVRQIRSAMVRSSSYLSMMPFGSVRENTAP